MKDGETPEGDQWQQFNDSRWSLTKGGRAALFPVQGRGGHTETIDRAGISFSYGLGKI